MDKNSLLAPNWKPKLGLTESQVTTTYEVWHEIGMKKWLKIIEAVFKTPKDPAETSANDECISATRPVTVKKAVWFTDIYGTEGNLAELEKLRGRSDVTLLKSYSHLTLELFGFSELADTDEVLHKAQEEVKILNGIGRLFIRDWRDIRAGLLGVRKSDQTYSSHVRLLMVARYHRREALPALSFKEYVNDSPISPIQFAYQAAESDNTIRRVLRLLGSDDESFRQLYVIYEAVESDVGGLNALISTGWYSKEGIRRFKHTANSVAVLGDESRHGKELTQAPKNPIGIHEANYMIRKIAIVWILSKQAAL